MSLGTPSSSTTSALRHPNLSIDSLLALFSRSFIVLTVKSLHRALLLPLATSLSAIFKEIQNAPHDIYPYLEFFIFPLAVLGIMPMSETRKIRRRNRNVAQRDYTFNRLHRWNSDRTSLIQELFDAPQMKDSPVRTVSAKSNVRRAEKLIREDGQLGKAVQALHSSGLAPVSQSTVDLLRDKHPVSPLPTPGPVPPQLLSVNPRQVLSQLQTFSKGTAGGRSGWRVQHFLSLCQSQQFLAGFTYIINLFLADNAPRELAGIVVSGSLVPLLKKDGGVRPIVVGEVFRRLLSKLCVAHVREEALQYFQPLQLGVGVHGGAEAVLHAFNRAIRNPSLDPEALLILVDFVNAFNEVNRQFFLDAVRMQFPAIYRWVLFCYSVGAPLFLQHHILFATTGVQQGDPLGPLLFALVLHPFLVNLKARFSLKVGAILDDVTFMGSPQSSRLALDYLRNDGAAAGLRLSRKTCVWSPLNIPIPSIIRSWSIDLSLQVPISVIESSGVPLLGSAVSSDVNFLNATVMKRFQRWQQSLQLMSELHDPQLELMLLRSCLGAPKMNYLIRSMPPHLIRPALQDMENLLSSTLQSILAEKDSPLFGQFQFQLSTLPIRCSGLGVYNPVDISMFAYISSLQATKHLQDQILADQCNYSDQLPNDFQTSLQVFLEYTRPSNNELPQMTQKYMATLFYQSRRSELLAADYITSQPLPLQKRFQAILSSVCQKHASSFLFALPNHGLKQVMTPAEFKSIMALRLLIPQFSGQLTCSRPSCTSPMDAFGYHALCCFGKSMIDRHQLVVEAIGSLASDAQLLPKLGAPVQCLGLTRKKGSSGKLITAYRPADLLIRWDGFRATCVDTTVWSPLRSTMPVNFIPGALAQWAEDDKYKKHLSACNAAGYDFTAFAVDTFGVLAPDAKHFLLRLAARLERCKNYPSYLAKQLVFRRVSFAIQLGVARQLLARKVSSDSVFSSCCLG